ncbi:hypothetical protein JOL62DRAFT_179011 [Phyllosticta paracitricarpa]|uniref:Uncharacterized protein n=1 Tax=Phyllosticta paracitricarpa TaxID=2016321 RepID=A0ABR1N1X0_9PEZI
MPTSGRSRSNSGRIARLRSWRPSFLSRLRSPRSQTEAQHGSGQGRASLRRHVRFTRRRPTHEEAHQSRQGRPTFAQLSSGDMMAIRGRGAMSMRESRRSDPFYRKRLMITRWPRPFKKPDPPIMLPRLAETDVTHRGRTRSSEEIHLTDAFYKPASETYCKLFPWQSSSRPRDSNRRPTLNYYLPLSIPSWIYRPLIFSARVPDYEEGQEDEEGEDSVDNGAEPSAAPADSSDGQNQPFSVHQSMLIHPANVHTSHASAPAAEFRPRRTHRQVPCFGPEGTVQAPADDPLAATRSYDHPAQRDSDIIRNTVPRQTPYPVPATPPTPGQAAANSNNRLSQRVAALRRACLRRRQADSEREQTDPAALLRRRIKRQVRAAREQERISQEAQIQRALEREQQTLRAMKAKEMEEKRRLRRKRAARHRERWRRFVESRFGRGICSYKAFRERRAERRTSVRYFNMVDQGIRKSRRAESLHRRRRVSEAKKLQRDRRRRKRRARMEKVAKRCKELAQALRKLRIDRSPPRESPVGDFDPSQVPGPNVPTFRQAVQSWACIPLPGTLDQQVPEPEVQEDARRPGDEGTESSSSSDSSGSSDQNCHPPHDDSRGPPPGPSGGGSSGQGHQGHSALSGWKSHAPHTSSPLRNSQLPPSNEPSSRQKKPNYYHGSVQNGRDLHPEPVVSTVPNRSGDSNPLDGMPRMSLQQLTETFAHHCDQLSETYGELKRREWDTVQHCVDCVLPILEDVEKRMSLAIQQSGHVEAEPVDDSCLSEANGWAQSHDVKTRKTSQAPRSGADSPCEDSENVKMLPFSRAPDSEASRPQSVKT